MWKWVDLVATWSCCQADLVKRTLSEVIFHTSCRDSQHQTVVLVHSKTFRRHCSRHHQSVLPFAAPSYELVKETSEVNPSTIVLPKTVTLLLLFVLALSLWRVCSLVRRMAKVTDDAGETFENAPSPLSDAGNHDNYYGRRLLTRCVLLSRPDNKTKLRQRGQPLL
ncbi:unnamed protein product [Protopolystoma xenopodis]|uniref:Uncharacterized protein n=1 Tax=Protopolystoma xenopodis TaxID=117903 RepID=A0A3S5A7F7_9PLAT|nr:unnamed protein product [Protopolystoma xenopodis]